jgi:hypothetical protein
MAMKNTAWSAFALALAIAPPIATGEAAGKSPPACVAIYFPPLPPGTTAGDHQVGVYDSPPARLELHADVNNFGVISGYHMLIGGKRIGDMDTPASMTFTNGYYRLPAAAAKCVAAKKMPKPEYRTSPSLRGAPSGCDGQGFTVVIAHAGDQRLALLYANCGNVSCGGYPGPWQFCSAAAF